MALIKISHRFMQILFFRTANKGQSMGGIHGEAGGLIINFHAGMNLRITFIEFKTHGKPKNKKIKRSKFKQFYF